MSHFISKNSYSLQPTGVQIVPQLS